MKIDPDALLQPTAPYRGILPFRLLDWQVFLERDAETERLANLVSMYRGVLLYGQSGAGKSSLLNAGLIPHALRRGRAPERIRVFPQRGSELLVERLPLQEGEASDAEGSDLSHYLPSRLSSEGSGERVALSCSQFLQKLEAPSELGVPLLIFDQFEELVTLFEESPKDKKRFEDAQAAREEIEKLLCQLLLNNSLPLKIVFAFRDDYLARLTPFFSRIPNLMDQGVRLDLLRIERLKQLVRGPFIISEDGQRGMHGHFRNESTGEPDELSEELAEKIATGFREKSPSGILNLTEVQTLCLALWQQPKGREELLRAEDPAKVLRQILESVAEAALKSFGPWDRKCAIVFLANLVTREGTRDVVSEENLIRASRRDLWVRIYPWDLPKLFKKMLEKTGLLRRSLRSSSNYYELTSEFLIPRIQDWQKQLLRRERAVWFAACVGLLAVAGLLLTLSIVAVRAKRDAVAATKKADVATKVAENAYHEADQIIGFMQYTVRNALRKTGNIATLELLSEQISQYYKDHPPKKGDFQKLREQAVSIELEGDVLLKYKRKPEEARERYQTELDIIQNLIKKDPDGALVKKSPLLKNDPILRKDPLLYYQEPLYFSYSKLGDAQRLQNHPVDALRNYFLSLAVGERLVKQDPSNADWQEDLGRVYWQTGVALSKVDPKSEDEARRILEKERDTLRQLKQRTGLTAQQKELLDAIGEELQEWEWKK